MTPCIACIIPTYNEGPRISHVLDVAAQYYNFSEIIVVDDGSTDQTSSILLNYKNVQVIKHTSNQGKAAALAAGVEKSTSEIVVFLDADLIGLRKENLDDLLAPVLKEKCMSVSLLQNAVGISHLLGIDAWSGQRALWKKDLDIFEKKSQKAGYAIELIFNDIAIKKGLPIYSIPWTNVRFISKGEKNEKKNGTVADIRMFITAAATFGLYKAFWQIFLFFPLLAFKKKILPSHFRN
mgnify:CR=1 FL=1